MGILIVLYRYLLKPFFFLLPAEKAHYLVFKLIKIAFKIPGVSLLSGKLNQDQSDLSRTVAGLTFPNPVGLAAGLDKNAHIVDELSMMGFGFIEIGTVTPLPQPGNPTPRLFRLPADEALINRMGFNNEGLVAMVKRLRQRKSKTVIGGNIGKNKITPNENAVEDYVKCFQTLYDLVDYFVINVSSPNTPGLRELQEKEPLKRILAAVMAENKQKEQQKPVFLKIAPDLTTSQIDDILEIVEETECAGVVATNTTISRENLTSTSTEVEAIGAGGVSGKPLRDKSTEIIRYIHKKSKGKIPVIGVGGIMNADDAIEKIKAGASIVQLYTGFIYQGPELVKAIKRQFLKQSL